MRRLLPILFLAALGACGRPLTPNEADFATRLFGPSFDPAPVRIGTSGLVGLREHRFPARPRTTCRERILPPPEEPWLTGRTAGITLWNHVITRETLARGDYSRMPNGQMHLGAAMFLAHELTHVWQWQNRAVTGYTPMRAGAEHRHGTDPYLFDPSDNARFTDFAYEQQASIVEEYVCCLALDPGGARTGRLRALMAQVMEPGDLPAVEIRLPWSGVERRGICS
ncbi:MAG: hypothetical protein Kow0013_01320 [Pararhodobacter sp.]